MTSGQSVGILGRIGVWRVIALVCGHRTQAMIYFQRVRIIDNLDTFAYILFRYAVMVKPEGDIAVTHYCCGASLFHLMAYGGKRAEAVGLNLLELFPSGWGRPLILRPLKAESDSDMAAFRDSSEWNTRPSMSA